MKMQDEDKLQERILIFMNKSKFIAILFKFSDKMEFVGIKWNSEMRNFCENFENLLYQLGHTEMLILSANSSSLIH